MDYPTCLRSSPTTAVTLVGLLLVTLFSTPSYAIDRPEWTERAVFTFGEELFAVGVATSAKTLEEGRQAAFENGKQEIRNYLQASPNDGAVIDTTRTWEERHEDGTYTVYRLLKIDLTKQTGPRKAPSVKADTSNGATYTADGLWRYAPWIEDECLRDEDGKPNATKVGQVHCHLRLQTERAAQEALAKDEEAARQLAQDNPEEYKRHRALKMAAARVEAETEELKQICRGLRKGFTREEVALLAGESLSQEVIYKHTWVKYLGGRLTLTFDSFGRLDSLGGCPRS